MAVGVGRRWVQRQQQQLLRLVLCCSCCVALAAAARSGEQLSAASASLLSPPQQHDPAAAFPQPSSSSKTWWRSRSRHEAAATGTATHHPAPLTSISAAQGSSSMLVQEEQPPPAAGRRRLLQLARADDVGFGGMPPAAVQEWLNVSAPYSRQYANGSCFREYAGFVAKDIEELVRLLRDPAATHIELRGDIVFSEALFPPAHAHNQSLGINITHEVTIRACTPPSAPITVDLNNLLQQIYVYGSLTWSGSIRFINSFPSPRRGGLFPLLSILSVEGDGVVAMRGVHIHGNVPSPLFDAADPYWSVYQNDSAFAPQPYMYTRVAPDALIMRNWTFNKRAWVLKSQGPNGVVRAQGSCHWTWNDVLITWSPLPAAAAAGAGGSSLALAIALPVVLGSALAAAALVWFCCRRHRRARRCVATEAGPDPSKGSSLFVAASGKSGLSNGRGYSYTTAGSATNCSKLTTASASTSLATQELIEETRRRLQQPNGMREGSTVLETLIGEGTFGRVYRGHWQGSLVAVKVMFLPAAMAAKEKREKMAIMETAISASLSHPNVVQTYTYMIKPLSEELALQMQLGERGKAPPQQVLEPDADPSSVLDQQAGGEEHGWEVRLVLELCDRGNLKEFLLQRGFFSGPGGARDMQALLATAMDVARAMLHLHSENIVHADLKARNVLLKSAGGDRRGFMAKVSDFGLSMRMDPTQTHVSNMFQGTLTTMAPEVLLQGKLSRASDVYAFGILLWELFTGEQAFRGMPKALLGHAVTQLGRRPEFPADCPFEYTLLACRCWESDPAIRPSFEAILAELQRMAQKLQHAAAGSGGLADSAASLAQQQRAGGAGCSGGGGGALPPAAGTAAAAAAAAAPPAGGGGSLVFDHARLHRWEPQTSLLGSQSSCQAGALFGSPPPAAAAAAAGPAFMSGAAGAGATAAPDQQPHQQQQQLEMTGVSVGSTWGAASGGPWFGGSLAPVEMPSALQLPWHQHEHQQQQQQQPGSADADAPPHVSATAAAAAAAGRPPLGMVDLGGEPPQQHQQQQPPGPALFYRDLSMTATGPPSP